MNWLDRLRADVNNRNESLEDLSPKIPDLVKKIRDRVTENIKAINEEFGNGRDLAKISAEYVNRLEISFAEPNYSSLLFFNPDSLQLLVKATPGGEIEFDLSIDEYGEIQIEGSGPRNTTMEDAIAELLLNQPVRNMLALKEM
jgi:hypothetical protein